MKTILVFSFLALANLYAYLNQSYFGTISVCNIMEDLCETDLSVIIPGIKIDSVIDATYGKEGVSEDVFYEDDGCEEKNTDYDHCEDGYNSMKYDVYYPDSIDNKRVSYSSCGLPAIIMFHGGSFKECSDKPNPGIKQVCLEMAKRGFIVFNVEYRRGVLIDIRKPYIGYRLKYISAQQILAIYRASQDVRGAIRTIIYKQRISSNDGNYKIDTNNLFVGGISAGSLAAMNAAYYERQGQIDSAWPGASTVMGDIDQDYYIGDTNINFIPKIKGVLDMWGAIAVHKSKSANPGYFLGGNQGNPAMIAFQGYEDDIFPVDTSSLYFSPDVSPNGTNYNNETNCLVSGSSFRIDTVANSVDSYAIGAEGIYKVFKNKGIPVEVYIDCTMGHGMDTGTPFDSDFGTSYTNQNDVYSYIAARSTTFFVTVIKGYASSLGRARFVECKNNRVKCDLADDAECDYDIDHEVSYRCTDFLNE
ncbi:MAG TPA: alpha/beta hydrolase [Panacibacter sp.]|nr:alpha/beta hydrolase [Panacibacter sp.]